MQELTKAEEEIMQILWKLEKAFVKEILEQFNDPKPAYNTVSTIVRILEKKEFISFNAFGKAHQYYPVVGKEEYKEFISKKLLSGYFDGSVKNLVSFFAGNKDIGIKEMDEILKILKEKE